MKFINKIKDYFTLRNNHFDDIHNANETLLLPPSAAKATVIDKGKDSHYVHFYSKFHTPQNNDNNMRMNKISTSKYTKFNFIPKILYEQFSKIANLYFLLIALFQTVKEISNSNGQPVILFPLFIVISINGAKDFYEDWKRKKSDMEENEKSVLIYDKNDKKFYTNKWENVAEGDVLKICEDEFFPADCVVIATSESNGACYIETKSIDGETNLKFKKANAKISSRLKINDNAFEDNLVNYDFAYLITQKPNEFIYEFSAKYVSPPENRNNYYTNTNNVNNNRETSIDINSFILRGCSLKQTKYVYAVAVYIGHDTKIMRNSPKSRNKTSRVESIMNNQIFLVFFLQMSISFIAAFFCVLNRPSFIRGWFFFFIVRAGTWLVLINNIVPISLLVTLEMVKYVQGLFIAWDIELYDTKRRLNPQVQTSTLNEELGQVKFIFADKTGTLTKNNMRFKAMSICDDVFGIDDDISANKCEYMNDPYGLITNFDFNSRIFKNVLGDKSYKNAKYIDLFLTTLAVCHTVVVEQKESQKITYQASSPDEIAMVNCARYFNYIFAGRDAYNNLTIKSANNNTPEKLYNILNILEYTSERKRMSVIAKCPDGKIRIFAKGADSVISEKIANKSLLIDTNKHLIKFAQKGLRTLMIAYRELSEEQYNKFDEMFRNASCASNFTDREVMMNKAIDLVERDLTLLGATAIEDELQDNVADTLKSFIDTGIKVWVLTGDKMDTAKSIAFSCELISHEFFIFEFPENSSYEDINAKLKEFSKEYYLSEGEQKKFALIVSLNELNKILCDITLTNLFYSLAVHCNSVLCCRVTPKQKAQMVSLVKDRQPNITTLAIGDGSNDVNMITTANIGIGIIGVEGRQAVRASDYAIAQFQNLKRLLFVHGRESYRKNSFIVCYNFYKNVLFVIPHFWFGFVSQFSGQYLYDPWLYQIFNILFASFPIIWFGIYDKEVSYDTLMNDNRYYMQGIIGKLFHSFRFWKWICYGILQASFIYVFSFYANQSCGNRSGNVEDLDASGSIAYSGVVVIVNLKIFLTTSTHTVISVGLFLLSTFAYYFILYIMSEFPIFFNFNNFSMISKGFNFYLSTLCLVMICVIIDVGTGTFLRVYGWVADPLSLRPEEFEPKVEIKEMEMLRDGINNNEINNKFTGSAFAQQENQNVAINVNKKNMFIE